MKERVKPTIAMILLLIVLLSALYLFIDIFTQSGYLYLAGGFVGGGISEILNMLRVNKNIELVFSIWFALWFPIIWLFLKSTNKISSTLYFIILFILLYLIDMIFASYSSNQLGLSRLSSSLIQAFIKSFFLGLLLAIKQMNNHKKWLKTTKTNG